MSWEVENNFAKAKEEFLNGFRKAARETKIELVADTQAITPVGTEEKGSIAPGTLKRSITGNYRVDDKKAKIEIGSPVIYARKVEYENKAYIRPALEGATDKVAEIFNRNLKESEL